MKLYKKVLFSFLFYIVSIKPAIAQRLLGISTGEYSAINSLYINPANIADCREKISISILSTNFDVNNSLGTFSKIGEYSITSPNNFKISGTGNFNMIIPDVEIHGPGIMYSINKDMSIALTTGFRVMNQFNNFDASLYGIITNPGAALNSNFKVSSKNFNWTANMWTEIGLTYAAVIRRNEKREVKIGFTIKKLEGIGYIGVTGKNIDVNYKADTPLLYASNTDIEFASNVINDSTAIFKGLNTANFFDKIFGDNAGSGLSLDLGVTYKIFIGDHDPSDYYMESNKTNDIIFSASITDFGAINYAKSKDASIQVSNSGYLSGPGISQNANNAASFFNYVKNNGFTADTVSKGNRVFLPTALLLSADIQMYGNIYGNLLYINNLANRTNFGNSYYNQISFTPRYEKHNMSFSLPITYSMLSNNFKIGLGCRISGFFIASDDALGFISKNQRGFDLYFGGYIPIFNVHHDPFFYW